MIKASGWLQGKPLLVIGLSDVNWERLRTGGDEGLGQPIQLLPAQLGLPDIRVVLIAGDSNEHMKATVEKYFGTPQVVIDVSGDGP
jgi:hypothetical protein